jgi:hypothetical protein
MARRHGAHLDQNGDALWLLAQQRILRWDLK